MYIGKKLPPLLSQAFRKQRHGMFLGLHYKRSVLPKIIITSTVLSRRLDSLRLRGDGL